ncbi:hypothetical protein GF337_13960 [candidate division KSB1 bacterium]|nr:hypothetical protein [candidate division KSB1 bacterium]
MTELNTILKQMADDIPGVVAMGVVGMDGLALAHHSTSSEFDIEVASAQFALVMKLVQKTSDHLRDSEVEDNLVTTKKSYMLTRFLGDGSYYIGIAASKEHANLGNMRLIARNYADTLWEAIPKRKK